MFSDFQGGLIENKTPLMTQNNSSIIITMVSIDIQWNG